MQSALPPAPHLPRPGRDLFHHLAELIRHAGAHITYGHLEQDATWDATTQTLTLREGADPDTHTWALSEFCRHWHLGADYSRFRDTHHRHLQVVS